MPWKKTRRERRSCWWKRGTLRAFAQAGEAAALGGREGGHHEGAGQPSAGLGHGRDHEIRVQWIVNHLDVRKTSLSGYT